MLHYFTHVFRVIVITSLFFWSCSETRQKPNIILIVTDDQGYGDVGFHGNEIVKTPRLDRFAQTALELTNFHTGTTCTPTRAGLMTGRNANRNGAWHTIAGASILNSDEQTMAEVFQLNGYNTAMFGKWHLGDSYPYRPQDRGFQEAFYLGGGGVQQTPDYWNNDYFDDTYFRNGVPEKTKGYCTDVWFDEAIKYITGNKEKPFFMYLATNAAHGPFNVPMEYREMYEDASLLDHQKNFYGMLTNLDDNFGRLEDYLKTNGLLDNTIIIYTTDNGTAGGVAYNKQTQETFGHNPLRGTKGSHYEGGHRVPFLIHWPEGGLVGGKKNNDLIAHVDLLPTLTTLAGIPFASEKPLDGSDASASLIGKQPLTNRVLVIDTQRGQWPEIYKNPTVMDGDWRLVNHTELYNTAADLNQKNNIASDHPDRVKTMQDFYDQWWESTIADWKHSPTFIGTKEENPVLITIHDMHPYETNGDIPWNQDLIRKGEMDTKGYYEIKVAEAGKYKFSLSRWPLESQLDLSAEVEEIPATKSMEGLSKGKSIEFKTATIKVGEKQMNVEANNDSQSASLTLDLVAGETTLEASFQTIAGSYFPAYYILVERIN